MSLRSGIDLGVAETKKRRNPARLTIGGMIWKRLTWNESSAIPLSEEGNHIERRVMVEVQTRRNYANLMDKKGLSNCGKDYAGDAFSARLRISRRYKVIWRPWTIENELKTFARVFTSN